MPRPRSGALVAALWMTALAPLALAQTAPAAGDTPAQKKPAKPGAQAGPAPADAASAAASAPVADKKPAKPGAQSGPAAASAPR